MNRYLLSPILLPAIALLLSCGGGSDSLTPAEARLADSVKFDHAAVGVIKEGCKDLARMRTTDNMTGEITAVDGITAAVREGDGLGTVRRLEPELARRGYHIYWSEMNFGHGPDEVGIIKGGDGYTFVKLRGTDGANYNISNDSVIAKLKEWDARFGLTIVGAAGDWVQADFKKQPEDMLAFAKEVYIFCPDIVDQGTNTVNALADEMKKHNTLYLWWD